MKQPSTEAKLRERGVVPVASGPEEFAEAMSEDCELYKTVVKEAGVKAE